MYEEFKEKMFLEVVAMKRDQLLDQLGGSLAERLPDGNILMTPTTAAFRRWEITSDELVVMDPNGELIEAGGKFKAAAAAPLVIELFKAFPKVGAIAHSHCLNSLVFAANEMTIPATTNGTDILGEIPCIIPKESDKEVKDRALADPIVPHIPSGYVQRREVMAVNLRLAPLIQEKFKDRQDELSRHGLAFTLSKHGLFVMARHLLEATENIQRVEMSAKVAILSMQSGLTNLFKESYKDISNSNNDNSKNYSGPKL